MDDNARGNGSFQRYESSERGDGNSYSHILNPFFYLHIDPPSQHLHQFVSLVLSPGPVTSLFGQHGGHSGVSGYCLHELNQMQM